MLKATAGLPVVAFLYIRYLFKHHLFVDNLSRSATDIVHLPHPSHWVGGFELFGYAFFFGVFFYQPEKKLLGLFLCIGKVGMEFSGSEQVII